MFELSAQKTQTRFLFLAIAGIALLGLWRAAFPFRSTVDWRTDLSAALDTAGDDHKPVLINFSSRACVYCERMEAEVFPTEAVRAELAKFVPVKIDVNAQEELAARYNVVALPTYVITDASGANLATVSGFQGPREFSAFLQFGVNAVRN